MDDTGQGRRTMLKLGGAALMSAGLVLPPTITSDQAFAETEKAPAGMQTIFSCHIDHVDTLQALSDEDLDWKYKILDRRAVQGDMRLAIDVHSRTITLSVRYSGMPAKAYVLGDIEQGNTPLSGASGHLGTVIRGKSGDQVFTLFAEEALQADEKYAVLQVDGPKNLLLSCNDEHYLDPSAKGLGRFGSIDIYGLSGDGLAKELKELPAMP